MLKKILLSYLILAATAFSVAAQEATVTEIIQHRDSVAVFLEPDPGPQSCEFGSPYLLPVDGQTANDQKFSMLLAALASGKKVRVFSDSCGTAIYSQSRPVIERLSLLKN